MTSTLKDVAKRAGVSVTTVSRVINNYHSLSDKTICKVRLAMRELDYQPNALARAMQGKSSHFIGLVLPNVTNPFLAELTNCLEERLFTKGYKVIIGLQGYHRHHRHRRPTRTRAPRGLVSQPSRRYHL